MLNPLDNRSVAAVSIDLSPSGHPRTNLVLNHIAGNFFFKLFHKKRPLRPRPHQAHIPQQHIEKLRHLVDAGLSDKPSHRRHSGVMGRRPFSLFLVRLLHLHRTELVHIKGPIVKSYPFLLINQRPRGGQLNQPCCHQHNRRKQNQSNYCAENIYNPLDSGIQQII